MNELSEECQRKDFQLAEAQEVKSRVMTVLGIQTLVSTAGKDTAVKDTMPEKRVRKLARRRKSSLASALKSSCHPTEQPGHDANISFESSSSKELPTPKRARPRATFKMPTTSTPVAKVSDRSPASAHALQGGSERIPLADVSHSRSNQTPVRRSQRIMDISGQKEKTSIRILGDIDTSFDTDMDGFFTSTPITQGEMLNADTTRDDPDATVDM